MNCLRKVSSESCIPDDLAGSMRAGLLRTLLGFASPGGRRCIILVDPAASLRLPPSGTLAGESPFEDEGKAVGNVVGIDGDAARSEMRGFTTAHSLPSLHVTTTEVESSFSGST